MFCYLYGLVFSQRRMPYKAAVARSPFSDMGEIDVLAWHQKPHWYQYVRRVDAHKVQARTVRWYVGELCVLLVSRRFCFGFKKSKLIPIYFLVGLTCQPSIQSALHLLLWISSWMDMVYLFYGDVCQTYVWLWRFNSVIWVKWMTGPSALHHTRINKWVM